MGPRRCSPAALARALGWDAPQASGTRARGTSRECGVAGRASRVGDTATHPGPGGTRATAPHTGRPHPRAAHPPRSTHRRAASSPRAPPQSGIDISDELLALYEEVKLRHKHKYFIFSLKQTGLEGNKTVWGWEINAKADPVTDDKNVEAFAEVVKQLPADEARFVVFDFVDTKADGRQIKKLVLIKWCVRRARARLAGRPTASSRGRVREAHTPSSPPNPAPPSLPHLAGAPTRSTSR